MTFGTVVTASNWQGTSLGSGDGLHVKLASKCHGTSNDGY
jgi:hypothetical protein